MPRYSPFTKPSSIMIFHTQINLFSKRAKPLKYLIFQKSELLISFTHTKYHKNDTFLSNSPVKKNSLNMNTPITSGIWGENEENNKCNSSHHGRCIGWTTFRI